MINSLFNYAMWVYSTVIFTRYVFGADEAGRSFRSIFIFIVCATIFSGGVMLFFSWFSNRYSVYTDQKIYYELNRVLFDKASSVDISCYENPEFYNDYTKALMEVKTRAISVMRNMSNIIAATGGAVFVLISMYSIDKTVALFTIFPVVGNFIFSRMLAKYEYLKNVDDTPYNRRKDYVNRAVYLQKFAKEIRLSNVFNVLKKTYDDAYDGNISVIKKYAKKIWAVLATKNVLIFNLSFDGAWLYAAYKGLVSKTLGAADLMILASAIVSTSWMLINLTEAIAQTTKNGLFIQNLRTFLEYKEKIPENQKGIIPDKQIQSLIIENLSFTYGGQTEPTLKNLNITINKGEKIALVGHNGAGKTTLVKLIMRFYDPTEGRILLNGIDIREYDVKAYRRLIGTVFQDFQIMSMTVLENVLMREIKNEAEREKAVDALRRSDIYEKTAGLSNGVDTILTREFSENGAVLSGGEFQKVAISRAFAKESSIMIMDEPSSALDPIAEYKMFDTMMDLCSEKNGNGKIVVFISHRLSSAVLADRIYLMENGCVAENGSHRDLMVKGGSYADIFLKQAQNYLKGEDIEFEI
ncbi:MAG: ABC transporter ATP-binding protein/permease [Oscillospiraceae bacterium]|nr:ABC transporter ATP-binding protein/permease [Oscillospiraceae bacterium]